MVFRDLGWDFGPLPRHAKTWKDAQSCGSRGKLLLQVIMKWGSWHKGALQDLTIPNRKNTKEQKNKENQAGSRGYQKHVCAFISSLAKSSEVWRSQQSLVKLLVCLLECAQTEKDRDLISVLVFVSKMGGFRTSQC